MTQAPREEIEELAALYAGGALPAEEHRAFERRLDSGDIDCVAAWRQLHGAVGELLEGDLALPPHHIRDAVMAQAESEAAERARDPAEEVLLIRAEDGAWQPTGFPGIDVRRLHAAADGNSTTLLLRFAPGASYPPHDHSAAEECLILEGTILVDGETLGRGDFQRLPAGTRHGVTRSGDGAVVLISTSSADPR